MSTEGSGSRMDGGIPAEVDRIRDIIFGPQMRLYEQQFKRLSGQFDALRKELRETRATLEQRQAEATANSNRADAEIREESRQSIQQLRADWSSRADRESAEFRAQLAELAADLRAQGEDVRAELHQAVDALEHDKASREHVGDLLIEMGTRLKQQAGIADLLGQLQGAAVEAAAE